MNASQYDVVVVGAGSAGVTAAIGLARSGFAVAVVEAAAFPGAENWSGCVYFCESLADPDILGPAGVEALAWERRLVERGFFSTDGHGLFGMTYRDPDAFRHCYTVLRPIYDHHLSQIAQRHGIALLNETTAESLIRDGGKVIGVCTNRGALYADLVFLAEGDASHLVTREGYERFSDRREAPKFLQGIKQVIDMPAGAIEEIFGVGPEEGVAYEMLLRNGRLRGRGVHLNMGGFLYTNRQSLSLGLVLPADNLNAQFGGDPNLLMEWFENLPALQPWLKGGRRGVYGAKLIRGGGLKDVPNLIDDGLAIGGAASAIGVDFPYPNFTGPATLMGLLLTRAARQIRAEGGTFTRDNLRRYYLEPLWRSHYWKDVEFLKRWPGYVKRTQVFFDRNLDLALGTAYVWTRPRRWLITRWVNWMRLVLHVAGPGRWAEIWGDMRHLSRALRLREVASRPALGRLLLDGTVNALRDLFKKPRANLPPAGILRLHCSIADQAEEAAVPRRLQRWFRRFTPVLASAARRVYAHDATPLADKLPGAIRLLLRQVNVLDLLAAGGIGILACVMAGFMLGWRKVRRLILGRYGSPTWRGLYPQYAQAARKATDLTPWLAPAAQHGEERLAQLAYETVRASHIQILWPRSLPDKQAVARDGLWHVCPAHVYEARVSPLGQLQVVVNFENCIKCETCWRTSDLVNWGRDGAHRFIYPVGSPVVARLLETMHAAGPVRPALPYAVDPWEPAVRALSLRLPRPAPGGGNGAQAEVLDALHLFLDQLEQKLQEFDDALAEEPRTMDRARADYLEMLARYAQQLALRVVEELRNSDWADDPDVAPALQQVLALATDMAAKSEERSRRTWDQRFAWAAASGRQLRYHHVAGLRRLLTVMATGTVTEKVAGPPVSSSPRPRVAAAQSWLKAEQDSQHTAGMRAEWSARLDAVFGPYAWRDLERPAPLSAEQDAALRGLIAQLPRLEAANLAGTLHPPLRKALLAELGRRDPSLAYRVATHLWARDLASFAPGSSALSRSAERWARGEEWASYAAVDAVPIAADRWTGEALFVPAVGAKSLLLLIRDQLVLLDTGQQKHLKIEPVATLGLRGAGLARVRLDGLVLPEARCAVDFDRFRRIWSVVSAADLTSIAAGMADQLCRRAVAHATSRVQFPGLFHDEQARDTIGKFGAVKKMIAEMEARRYLIETLDHTLSPVDFSGPSLERAGLVKAIVAEALGTAPGSVSYNAGQIFGGTGYSEDDILSKFYRDAAAWRFLGPPNVEIYHRHGQELLRNWRPDGQRLAGMADEMQLFEEVAQRKALQAELDEVRNLRSRLRTVMAEWQQGDADARPRADREASKGARRRPSSALFAEVAEALARQDAHLLASKALLLRTHARLEQGLNAESEIALVRVWLEEVADSLEHFDRVVRRWLHPADQHALRPVVEPSAGPPVALYADYLAAAGRYDSGDFLATPLDLTQPRYVPEMVASDPALAAADREIRDLLTGYFGRARHAPGSPLGGAGGAETYERYVERRHRPDPEDLDFCRAHGFFRMPIPKDLGGEGRSKADYYLLTTNAQRLVDVSVSLTIQANTSIGTTPVLLARDKDLPKAQHDLAPFIGDASLQQDIRQHLEELLRLIESADPVRIDAAYRQLHKYLEGTVFARTVLKVLTFRFAEAWQRAAAAGKAFDLAGMRAALVAARDAWKDACGRAAELHAEILHRRRACDLFLRWVASGQISAFALTEPSAGSDTARVATRARLRSVPVEREADGVYRFVPAGGHEPRTVLDAQLLEFRPDGVFYRYAPAAEPARIWFDDYDYEGDDPAQTRYFERDGRRVRFTDIAQLRERDGRLWYDYWELTGAKMWITNGRMSGIMCLYAKVEEPWVSGVTGFIVDRHAEGLVVGKDEAKMGQCGSPTNELSLQAVRVPRENVIGLEGRGQVNALETLNVGRAGLAMSAMAQMAGLIDSSRAFARGTYGDVPDWIAWRLERMEEDRFTAEALAFEVIGRFEHTGTKSARMESAISKMLVSELLHQVIERAEDIHGLAGQTQLHVIEKRKRDARILNIYEGTNEVQRFLILKELAAEVAPRWANQAAVPPQHLSREALEVETLKRDVRQRVEAALAFLGQELWQNPNLQANCFHLSDATAWLKAADSTLGRLAWLSRYDGDEHDGRGEESSAASEARSLVLDMPAALQLARRSLARCAAEVRDRLQRFDEELAHLRRGYYAPEVRAASLLFDRAAEPHDQQLPVPRGPSHVERPLRVLVVVEPSASGVPRPHLSNGHLLEPHLVLSHADRAALETALRLRDEASAPVTIDVAAVGPRGTAHVLRAAISLGVERVRLVVPDGEVFTPDSAAAALTQVLKGGPAYDLILGGSSGGNEEGLLAHMTAESLGVPHAGMAARLVVRSDGSAAQLQLIDADGRAQHVRPLPAAVAIEAGLPLRSFRISDFLTGLAKMVEFQRWPKKIPCRRVTLAAPTHAAAETTEEGGEALQPDQAARRVLAKLGLSGTSFAHQSYEGEIEDVAEPAGPGIPNGAAVAVIAAEPDGRLRPAALTVVRGVQALVDSLNRKQAVFLLVPPAEEAQRRAVAQLRDSFAGDVVLLAAERLPQIRDQLLIECWPNLSPPPVVVVGESWAEAAFAALACRSEKPRTLSLRVRRLVCERNHVFLETSRAGGKLVARQSWEEAAEGTGWMTLTSEAEVDADISRDNQQPGRVVRWSPPLRRFYGRDDIRHLLEDLKQETGVTRLADAEFIVDVGFGIGNRDGFEEVIEPLERSLRELGVRSLMVGGSRKVTEELHLLPADRQIGQSGVSVNPQILLAIGISGAPQHLSYIGPRATVVAFNRDPEAPLVTLNQRQPRPRVLPVIGDLFETVPAFTAALQAEFSDQVDREREAVREAAGS